MTGGLSAPAGSLSRDAAFDQATLLIGLGAPRTGSKWLSNYFTQHPDILMSPIRVLHFFDATDKYDLHFEAALRAAEASRAKAAMSARGAAPGTALLRERVQMSGDPKRFIEYFKSRWSSEKVFADVTPSYYVADRDVFSRMRDIHPKVKFLFVMRNPIDRYWSEMRLALMQDAQYDVRARLDHLLRAKTSPWRHSYAQTLTDLDAVIPAPTLKVCFFEDLFQADSIRALCDFLGVTPHAAELDRAMNQSGAVDLDSERRARLYAKFEPVYRFVHDRYGGAIPPAWLEDMERFGAR